MNPFINTAIKAARQAGKIILKGFDRLDIIKVTKKSPRNFVTDIDKAAEEAIIEIIQTAYPQHGFLAEESGLIQGQSEYQWIIDPLDGTTNFIHGYPHFSTSIALLCNGRIEHGLIYDPIRNDLFTASRGDGAQRNGFRMRVSERYLFEETLFSVGNPYHEEKHFDAFFEALKSISKISASFRRSGSAALDLAYVAAGQLDAFWDMGLKPWDIAAGILLMREAGGFISDIDGSENYMQTGHIVASNKRLFKELIKIIKPCFEK